MKLFQGKGVSGGTAVGKIVFFQRHDTKVTRKKTNDPKQEESRFLAAKKTTLEQLQTLYEKAQKEVGEANAQIFEIHQMMLADEDYNDSVRTMIYKQQVNAEYAVAATADNFASLFSTMDNAYMQGRAADVRDISNRIIRNLGGMGTSFQTDETCILCADDLTPSETVTLDKDKVLAFVTQYGSTNSHTAILGRMMNIPAIIGVGEDLDESLDGKLAAVDGTTGIVYLEPDTETIEAMQKKQAETQRKRALLETLKGKENRTLDGKTIQIFANISSPQDVAAALLQDAGGIGLFRSEFLYLERMDFPDEQTQFSAYKKTLESMAEKQVIIRTMDIGADKKIDYFGLEPEENPALGYRAIRICLTKPDIFRTQLRALLRASVYGNLAILFPMITSLEEVHAIKDLLNHVKTELTAEGLPFAKHLPIGIMLETPAAAILSDQLAPEVDFFSVGTNDLIQYTLAVDRQNPKLEPFYNPHHEAVLRLIAYAAKSAHAHGKWIGICGELAADTTLTETWLRMGIDELSVAPPFVLEVRAKVRETRVETA